MSSRPADAAPAQLRLFIALWPDPATRDAIAAWQHTWTWPERATPVRLERLHLTVHFLGNVPSVRLPALAQALNVPCEKFSLLLETAEVWPNAVAVLRPQSPPQELLRLHAVLGHRIAAVDLPLDTRPYRPHVTLARRAGGARPPTLPQLQWPIDQGFVLVRSLPGGAGYQVLERFGQRPRVR